jgi:hypothetical protein
MLCVKKFLRLKWVLLIETVINAETQSLSTAVYLTQCTARENNKLMDFCHSSRMFFTYSRHLTQYDFEGLLRCLMSIDDYSAVIHAMMLVRNDNAYFGQFFHSVRCTGWILSGEICKQNNDHVT